MTIIDTYSLANDGITAGFTEKQAKYIVDLSLLNHTELSDIKQTINKVHKDTLHDGILICIILGLSVSNFVWGAMSCFRKTEK